MAWRCDLGLQCAAHGQGILVPAFHILPSHGIVGYSGVFILEEIMKESQTNGLGFADLHTPNNHTHHHTPPLNYVKKTVVSVLSTSFTQLWQTTILLFFYEEPLLPTRTAITFTDHITATYTVLPHPQPRYVSTPLFYHAWA